MPSNAYLDHLEPLLDEADVLLGGRPGPGRGRRFAAAVNRAVVIACVSAWEAYLEELLRESLAAVRAVTRPAGAADVLTALADRASGRFNTPNPANTRALFADYLGLPDLPAAWSWRGSAPARTRARLDAAMQLRHRVAHGVNPRPVVPGVTADELPEFFLRLGRATDAAVRGHLVNTLGVPNPWPA
ncbi:MAG: hypothetical protein K2X87_05490 [Gemmataceae bacterium]|nr:hypothetical protein [Gemmataceae bacterium]